jgi:hypothetical protein
MDGEVLIVFILLARIFETNFVFIVILGGRTQQAHAPTYEQEETCVDEATKVIDRPGDESRS